MRLPLVWRPAPSRRRRAARSCARRSGSSTSRRRSARSPASSRTGVDAGHARCPSTTPTPTHAASSGCSPSGTASCSASASTCARSPATAGCAPRTGRATVHDGTEGELYDLADDPLQQHNRWDDPALPVAARRPRRRPVGRRNPRPATPVCSCRRRCRRPGPRHADQRSDGDDGGGVEVEGVAGVAVGHGQEHLVAAVGPLDEHRLRRRP